MPESDYDVTLQFQPGDLLGRSIAALAVKNKVSVNELAKQLTTTACFELSEEEVEKALKLVKAEGVDFTVAAWCVNLMRNAVRIAGSLFDVKPRPTEDQVQWALNICVNHVSHAAALARQRATKRQNRNSQGTKP